MTGRFQAPKGTYDLLPPRSALFLAVVEALSGELIRAGYGHVQTPMFEDTELFARGVGESTDVVQKEMYTFTDRGGRSLTLRPEGTAGVMRAILEHNLLEGALPVKLWYTGPNFRYEQPQSGRYRQHTQVGAEAVGVDDPLLDAELITLADRGYRALGLRDYDLRLTSLGCGTCRPPYRARLTEFLAGLDLDEPTRVRAELNPLRVLDDKRPEVKAMVADAPVMLEHLCDDCAAHFGAVRAALDAIGVDYVVDRFLVRGLDYYTRTTFEFVHRGLGAQASIGGGGRYDGLIAELGGPEAGGVGFGLGVDRAMLACEAEGLTPFSAARVEVFGVGLSAAARSRLAPIVAALREAGIRADQSYGDRGLKGAMRGADRSGARYALVLGDRDIEAGVAQVKDLSDGTQTEVALADVVEYLVRAANPGD
ncbi:MAG: histidine--tRNA ligase [Actinomycetales bacterium]|nr:histidine--tRNA ligase [Actinomycetales bacterium]